MNQRRLIIVSAYIEPGNDANDTIDAIDVLLMTTKGSQVCLGMDGNGKHPLWGSKRTDARGVIIADLISAHNMEICNTGVIPTFEARNHKKYVSSIIDITIVSDNMASLVTDWSVNMTACKSSDHNAIEFRIATPELYIPIHRDSTFLFHNKTADWMRFRAELKSKYEATDLSQWESTLIPSDTIDGVVVKLNNVITEACYASMKLRGNFRKFNPFWTPKLEQQKLQVIRLHHAVHSKVTANHSTNEILDAVRVHQESKSAYAKAIGKASKDHFRSFCSRQGKEDVWSVTNRIIKDAPRKTPPAMLKIADGYTNDASEAANALLNHFYPDDSPDVTPMHSLLRQKTEKVSDAADDPPFIIAEILEALQSMNPDRAPGPDHLTSDIVTVVVEILPSLIVNIMNSCLASGRFPDAWKSAQVRILQKPGKEDYTNLSSFRPIGLLPVMGKLLEKLFVKRLTYRAQQEEAWDSRQYGFKEQVSTVTALHSLITKIKEARESGLQAVGVSLDIKAAFDNAWWPSLMDGLRRSKCPRNVHILIQDYFRRRTVSLHYGDASASKVVTKGCVQGSVCGPTFWNIILDGLLRHQLPDGCHLQAYADDVMLLATGRNKESIQQILNDALASIHAWGQSVKLTFSPSKTFAISFTPASKGISLTMDGAPVTMAKEIKLLGVIIDWRLTFINHAKYVIRKVTRTFQNLCKFVRPTWGVNSSNVEIIYRHVIEPTVVYAAGVWGTAVKYKCVRRQLRTFQRSFAIRAIKGFRTVSAVSSFALANFMPLHLQSESSPSD